MITVCLNSEADILNCIESVKEQEDVVIEHIFVDGGSIDNTHGIISSNVKDPKIYTWTGSTIYEALNFGIEKSSSEIIGILHSNDIFAHSKVLVSISDKFKVQPDLDVFFGSVEFVSDFGSDISLRKVDSSKFNSRSLDWGFMPAHPGMFHRRRVFYSIGGYDVKYVSAADFKYCYEMLRRQCWTVEYSPSTTTLMSLGGTSTSGIRSMVRTSREISEILWEYGVNIGPSMHFWRVVKKFVLCVDWGGLVIHCYRRSFKK